MPTNDTTDEGSHARTPSVTTGEDSSPSISKDDAFHVLQNSRRRAVLRYLLDHDDQEWVVMRDLSEAVAAREQETSRPSVSSEVRQRVYVALYQSHLPKLARHGIITYDQGRGLIRRRPRIELFAPFVGHGEDALPVQLTGERDDASSTEPRQRPAGDHGASRQ